MNEKSKWSRHPNGPDTWAASHRPEMTTGDSTGQGAAASMPVEDSYSAGSLYQPDVIYTDESLNRDSTRTTAPQRVDRQKAIENTSALNTGSHTQAEPSQVPARASADAPASGDLVEPIRAIKSDGNGYAPAEAARMMDAIREIAALNRRIATQLLGSPNELTASDKDKSKSGDAATSQPHPETTKANSAPVDESDHTQSSARISGWTHLRLDTVEQHDGATQVTASPERENAPDQSNSPDVNALDDVDEWMVTVESTGFGSSSIVVDSTNLDSLTTEDEVPVATPKKRLRIDSASRQPVPKPHLDASHLAMESSSEDQLVIENDSRPNGNESRWPANAEQPEAPTIEIRSVDSVAEPSGHPDAIGPRIEVAPVVTESEAKHPDPEVPSQLPLVAKEEQQGANESSVTQFEGDSSEPALGPLVIEASSTRAAWEVDCFRWPEVTNRLLRDETDCFDTVLESLQLGQRSDRRAVLISGAEPNEGRSTLAICLARRARSLGFRTLLVDADVRHGNLDQLAGLDFEMGWRCPEAEGRIEEGLVRCLMTNLVLMPLGKSAGAPNKPSVDYENLWGALRTITPSFEIVILDGGIVAEISGDLSGSGDFLHTALLMQGTHEMQTAGVVKAYQSLKQLGIGSVAIAETSNRRMAG